MIEYRTERVDPSHADDIAEMLAPFGWELVDSQEIYNESEETTGVDIDMYGDFRSAVTGKSGAINVHTRKNITNYVSLRFARDTGRKNYAQLSSLNEEFENLLDYPKPKKPVKLTAIACIALAVILISVVMALVESTAAELWEILVCVIAPVVFIPLVVAFWIRYKKKIRLYYRVCERIGEIVDEANSLL